MTDDRQDHWEGIYRERTDAQLSWHQDDPSISLELSDMAGLSPESSVIDIGGGTSRFAAGLIAAGVRDIAVLDLSGAALETARQRLGADGDRVTWIVADVTAWTPTRRFDLWHDRAVFHFLVDPDDRAAYLARLADSLRPGGHAIIATFAPDGPEMCSGLPVVRYSPDSLARTLGPGFAPVTHRLQEHRTPWGKTQSFQFSLFRNAG